MSRLQASLMWKRGKTVAHPAIQNLGGLDWVDIRLLEEISFLAQDHGYSTPGRQYLSQTIGCSIRTISRHLSRLVRLGFIQRIQRSYRRSDGTIINRTNLYRIACGIPERIQNFLGTIGEQFGKRSTGEPTLAHIPKTKKYKPIRKRKSVPKEEFLFQEQTQQPLPEKILGKFPLLKRWLERGQAI